MKKIILILIISLIFVNVSFVTGADLINDSNGGEVNLESYKLEESNAYEKLQEIKLVIEEMEIAGFGTYYVEDLYIEAEKAYLGENITQYKSKAKFLMEINPSLAMEMFDSIVEAEEKDGKIGEDYDVVLEKIETIKSFKVNMINIQGELEYLAFELDDVKNLTPEGNFSKADDFYNDAIKEFENERLSGAENLINQSYTAIDESLIAASWVNVKLKASQRSLKYFILNNKRNILIGLVLLTLIGFIWWNEYLIQKRRKEINNLGIEKMVLDKLRFDAEKSYYQEKDLSKSEFEIKSERYKERVLEVNERGPLLNGELNKYIKRRKYFFWKKY